MKPEIDPYIILQSPIKGGVWDHNLDENPRENLELFRALFTMRNDTKELAHAVKLHALYMDGFYN
jgi:hypothetical protein